MDSILDLSQREKVAFVLKTIAHPVRIGIIELLTHHQQLTVNEICEGTDCEQSLISHHLAIMRLKGILSDRKQGKNVYYSLQLQEVINVIECIEHCHVDQLEISKFTG